MSRSLISSTSPLVAARVRSWPSSTSRLAQRFALQRLFSSLPSLRPVLYSRPSIFRPPVSPLCQPTLQSTTPLPPSCSGAADALLDLLPRTAITTHPALAGPGVQIRYGPRNTMNRNTRLIQKRRHGFLSRVRTPNGRKLIARRRSKGRKRLAAGC